MNCTICGKPVVLIPSARERAQKYGDHPAKYYASLFREHADCVINKRNADTLALIALKAAK